MSSKPKKRKNKKPPSDVILVDRKAFLSALGITSAVMQALGDEFESLRRAVQMDPEMRKALLQVVSVHLKNVAAISTSFQLSIFDPVDPDGTKGKDLN